RHSPISPRRACRSTSPRRASYDAGPPRSAKFNSRRDIARRGNCWDNAVAESFFATLKVELAHDALWATRAQARGEVFEYLERFYNGRRRHSALGYLSPLAFERQWASTSGTAAMAASPAVVAWCSENASSVKAPGSTWT